MVIRRGAATRNAATQRANARRCRQVARPKLDSSRGWKEKVSSVIPAQSRRAVTGSLDLRQRKSAIFDKPTGPISKRHSGEENGQSINRCGQKTSTGVLC